MIQCERWARLISTSRLNSSRKMGFSFCYFFPLLLYLFKRNTLDVYLLKKIMLCRFKGTHAELSNTERTENVLNSTPERGARQHSTGPAVLPCLLWWITTRHGESRQSSRKDKKQKIRGEREYRNKKWSTFIKPEQEVVELGKKGC